MGSTTVQAPAPRNIGQETSETLESQIALAPEQYAAYAEFAPKYAQTDINTLGQALFGQDFSGTLMDINDRLTQAANLQSQQSNTAQRAADVADVAALGGQVLGLRQGLNPQLYQGMNQFQQSAFGAIPTNASADLAAQNAATGFGSPLLGSLNERAMGSGMSPLLKQQNEIAAQQLALGGNLSPSELRDVQQSSRAGFAARGLGATNASVTDEVLQTDAAKRQRLLQSLGIAGAVEAQNQGAAGLQNQLGLGVQSANLGAGTAQQSALAQAAQFAEMQRQYQMQLQQQAIANQQATFFDPFQGVLGRSSGNIGTNQGLFGNAGATTAGANAYTQQMFNPFNAYASDLYNTNYNAQAAANIANANNRAGILGGLLGGLGSLGGGFLAGRNKHV